MLGPLEVGGFVEDICRICVSNFNPDSDMHGAGLVTRVPTCLPERFVERVEVSDRMRYSCSEHRR